MDFDFPPTVDQGGRAAISSVHPDIIRSHILTRLDAQTLAFSACTSHQLHELATDDNHWRVICNRTWPSTTDPRLRHHISAFPAGYRSLYRDSFAPVDHRLPPRSNFLHAPPTSQLISAVDVQYLNRLIISELKETETESGWFMCSPFRIDLTDPQETARMRVKFDGEEDLFDSDLEENMNLSWILIDPTRNLAAKVASVRPVSVNRHWLTGDILVRFVTVISGGRSNELVLCVAVVTCRGKEGGELVVKEVSLQLEDMDGKNLSGKESLALLQEAMEAGTRKREERWEIREWYKEYYLKMRRERREIKERRERRLDMVFIATGITIFAAWAFLC